MNTTADDKKPPLAPKPKILDQLTSKLPSSLMSRPLSASRGPKPPIAPKPKLIQDSEDKCCLYTNNNLNRCTNGKLLFSEEEFNEENTCSTRSESEGFQIMDDGYIMLPDNETLTNERDDSDNEERQLFELSCDAEVLNSTDSIDRNGEVELEEALEPDQTEDNVSLETYETGDTESSNTVEACTELVESVEALNDDRTSDSEHREGAEAVDSGAGAQDNDTGGESAQDLGEVAEDVITNDDENQKDQILDDDTSCGISEENNPNQSPSLIEGSDDLNEQTDPEKGDQENLEDLSLNQECEDQVVELCENMVPEEQETQDYLVFSSNAQQLQLAKQIVPCSLILDANLLDETVTVEPDLSLSVGDDVATINMDNETNMLEEFTENETNDIMNLEKSENIESFEEEQNVPTLEDDIVEDDSAPEETHAYIDIEKPSHECEGLDQELVYEKKDDEIFPSDTEENVYSLAGADDLSDESAKSVDTSTVENINNINTFEDEALSKLEELVVEPEETETVCTDVNDYTICNQDHYGLQAELCTITLPEDLSVDYLFNRPALLDDSELFSDDNEGLIVPYMEDIEQEKSEDTISEEHVYEEAGLDTDGENLNFVAVDRKTIVTRTRSYSGKVPGYVPETVPEESDLQNTNEYCTVALDKSNQHLGESEQLDINRTMLSKSRRFILYPRSYSVEGRDMPMSVYRENDGVENCGIKRNDDNLFLPCVIGSSGSFSQRSYLSSSGMSTPSSVVDIPPPFELACITKKPVTKSSPSLLMENESSDKPKKKKLSFKRFLTLRFKKKTENKVHVDVNVSSSRSSSESSHQGPLRLLELDRRSLSSSPQMKSRSGKARASDSPSTFLFYKDGKRKGTHKTFSRSVSRVESFEDRSRPPFMALPLTKPRSISFPNADTSDYENIPAMNSDYENIQIPLRRPSRTGTFTEFFEDPCRALSSANENDGYVDMSSFNAFESNPQTPDQETESAYTEPYRVCPVSLVPVVDVTSDEDEGKSSGEEDSLVEHNKTDGQSRAFYIAKELVDSEKVYVESLKLLHVDFREAIQKANCEQSEPVVEEENLTAILCELPQVYELHQDILKELEERINDWEAHTRIADVILSRRPQFNVFNTYLTEFDRNIALLDECCQKSQIFASAVQQFEQSPACANVSVKHQLLKVVLRVLQYRMLLTDYLNNLSPDSSEYEDTQAALVIVSEVADRANDSMRQGENLLRLVHIEYSVRGQRDLLQPGRVFVKEGTLMKVSRKNRHPRHLFLMNDVLLYTYPQQDGKYRLKNTLSLSGMKISKPIIDKVQNALKIEGADYSIILSASSCSEREDWYHVLSRAVADHSRGRASPSSVEAREKLWMCLGEKPPTLVPVSHVMMCMNCASDFSLTLRRHHCHACGKIVCRSCSRNKCPLKYLKDRLAKVCDQCYTELKKRGVECPTPGDNLLSRSSGRPLSAVFQSIHPTALWKQRKNPSALTQVAASAEGSSMNGPLRRCKRNKRHWKNLWFVIKDKVLYTYTTSEDKVATESLPLLGFTVKLSGKVEGGMEASLVFQLYHKKTLYYTFQAENTYTAQRWVEAIEEATVL
ncbi:FYVE, RhoGEF and PH domain-containing protein 5-like [Polyodon spathula]|uniref:FYVE, RhoGEF and PH domain-containing protein 5-like n=1 Tax=Polyodon spathula TaxID=7913 RepID=UPI001B7E894F|nr:FYVE, RhoGEF and PH domain-containing protein 5-like [Polyodon spathula]